MPYLGSSPRNTNTRSVIDHQSYLGSQADTSTNSGYYTFYCNYTIGNVSVILRGVHMADSDYTATNGTDIRISSSSFTINNDDVIEIIGHTVPSSQILERSDVNITGGAISNAVLNNTNTYNFLDNSISGDKIDGGTISDSVLKLKSTGDSIVASDGTTSILSESGSTVTLANVDTAVIGTDVNPEGTLRVYGSSDTTNTGATLIVDDNAALASDVGGTISFRGTDGSSQRAYGIIKGGKVNSTSGNFDGYLSFQTRSNNQANTAEAMRIDSSGNVGIGVSPNNKLDVNGNIDLSASTTEARSIEIGRGRTDNGYAFIDFVGDATYSDFGLRIIRNNGGPNANSEIRHRGTGDFQIGTVDAASLRLNTANTARMRIDSSGNIGAPSGTNIYNASDERLKQNITELSGCLQKVLSMRGVSFNWIDEFCDSEADKTLYGLIAQELQIVDSNLVDSFSDSTITAGSVTVENPLRVNEKFIIPMLVESIKEQQSQIDALTARIEALETGN